MCGEVRVNRWVKTQKPASPASNQRWFLLRMAAIVTEPSRYYCKHDDKAPETLTK